MKNYGKITLGVIVAWFVFALTASTLHLFVNPSNGIGAAVGIAATVPLILFAVWFATSEKFREFALSLNPQTLTLIQSVRVIGVVFVILEARHLLPAVFAWPAGYGDIFIGATAGFVALKLVGHRTSFIAWQILGILDLVNAVALGTIAPGALMVPMTVLPLSLIPTFAVPLLLIFHVISIAQARRWKAASFSASPVASLSRA